MSAIGCYVILGMVRESVVRWQRTVDIGVVSCMTLSTATQDTAPCVGCGMCCDGTIHARTTLTPAEQKRLEARGIEMVSWDKDRFLPQPCPMAKCGSCTIYEDRFEVCRSFRCSLLKSFEAGEIDGLEAAEKVATAKQLLASVVADDPKTARWSHRMQTEHDYAVAFTLADTATRQALAPKLLRIKALNVHLDRWFAKSD